MLFLTTLFCALPLAFARPTGTVPRGDNETSTADPMPVDAARAATFVRPAHFASLAYCSTKQLSTSAIDKVVPGVELLQSGGDGGATPVYYIAHDPENQSIVVAHEGTDPTNL
ncbi:hypothetical protein PLICRDRAFT_304795 [Plicaturopsis crispa FD-325 SS-3]|nr:hypothetical protein PLICRDRAFT_304795 [Plicaturopsis crispa FD-325 SS-3]